MKKITWLDRIRYRFDNTMSRGPAGLIVWLALISALVVASVTLLVLLAQSDADKAWTEILWDVLFQTITPNPVDPKAGSTIFLGGMLFATIVSLLLVSIFIGVLTNAIDQRIQSLRKGRSTILEHDHTLILGWSSQVFTIIAELVEANANQSNAHIVILADKDKIAMEDEVRTQVPHTRTTHIICRTGSPLEPNDLEMVNPHTARAIIVLAREIADPDTYVIKTMLALTNNPNRKRERYHIVAEIHEEKNMQVAQMVARDEVQLVLVSDLISRVAVQTSRQSGLSVVYTELLNFEGDEIYFQEEPALVGKTFGDALCAYENSTVIGLQAADGRTLLNPPSDTRITPGDRVIAISADDDTVILSGRTLFDFNLDAIQALPPQPPVPERTLILGWNRHTPKIINELDAYLASGSQTTVVANVPEAETLIARVNDKAKNQTVFFQFDDTTDRHLLNTLNVPSFQHVIVLSYSDLCEVQEADAKTLITLLHLRDLSEQTGVEFSIVSEMLDVRNRNLAEVTRADDFIVSDQLVSLALAQVSENRYLNALFADLFDSEGAEIYLKPAQNYVGLGKSINFYTVVESARRQNQVAIGYRLGCNKHDAAKSYGVVVNPNKSEFVTFAQGDNVIVLAES
jgi:ion channel POLLUX/CASTOR